MWPTVFVCEALEAVLPLETLAKTVVSERWELIGWMKTERLHVGLGNCIASGRDAWGSCILLWRPKS